MSSVDSFGGLVLANRQKTEVSLNDSVECSVVVDDVDIVQIQ